MLNIVFRALLIWLCGNALASALDASFSYQGRLTEGGAAVSGTYDLEFTLHDAENGGTTVSGPTIQSAVNVANGLFTVRLDLGAAAFNGQARWLAIGVRPSGSSGEFALLVPRQPVNATPYALHAIAASSVPAAGLTGSIAGANIADGIITAAMLAPGAVSRLSAPDGAPSHAVSVDINGLVGVGTTAPEAGVDIGAGAALTAAIPLFQVQDGTGAFASLNRPGAPAVAGNLIAIPAYGDNAVTLVNFLSRSSPSVISVIEDGTVSFQKMAGPAAVAWQGSVLAVAAFDDHAVTLISTADPASPLPLSVLRDGAGVFTHLGGPRSVAISRDLLAIGAYVDNAVTLMDISDPSSPVQRSIRYDGYPGFAELGGVSSVALAGTLLVVGAELDDAVTLVDVGDLQEPSVWSTLKQGANGLTGLNGVSSVALSGNLLAIAGYESDTVTLMDVTDPDAPQRLAELRHGVGGYTALDGPQSVSLVSGRLAIAASISSAVTLVDVSSPSDPVLLAVVRDTVGGAALLGGACGVALTDSHLLVTASQENSLTVLGLSPQKTALATTGWVGIGTRRPLAPLEVIGNVVVEGAELFDINASRVELGLRTSALGDGSLAAGRETMVNGDYSAIVGGLSNVTHSPNSFIGAGTQNTIQSGSSNTVIGSGLRNIIHGDANESAIVGGADNTIFSNSTNSIIGGGRKNMIQPRAPGSTIVGGVDNVIGSDQRSAFIGGGERNEIKVDNQHAVIVGGRDNSIGTNVVISLLVGGGENRIGNNVDGGLMVGGYRNDILGSPNPNRRQLAPVLIGGSDNEIGRESHWTVILGGDANRIGTNSPNAVILGGTNNLVADNSGYSLAAGRRSRVNHMGAFVFADSQNDSFASSGQNTFNIRAEGGLHLNDDTSQFFGSQVRQMLNLWNTDYGIGIQSSTLYCRTSATGSFSWFQGGVHADTANTPGVGGVELMRLNGGGLRVNGTFVSASDRDAKEGFEAVNPAEVLDKVMTLPVTRWRYRTDEARTSHLGPVAQDFHAAFGVGFDDKHIATVDADGVALAAIQGLNRKLEQALRDKAARIAELEKRLDRLERLLDQQTASAR
jgi:hypothetical protein